MPVGSGLASSDDTSVIGRAGTAGATTTTGSASTGSSTIVFHSPQPSHLPDHLGAPVPHSMQA